MREIVGIFTTDNQVTNDPKAIARALLLGTVRRYLSKQEMELMARWDLGPKWEQLARSPVLFQYDDDTGKFYAADGSEIAAGEKERVS